MKGLYRFSWDCGRMGEIDSLFIAEEEEIEKIIGCEVNFGEVLGKHSEIYGKVSPDDITLISDEQDKIDWLYSVIGSNTIVGHNPLDYYDDEGKYDD